MRSTKSLSDLKDKSYLTNDKICIRWLSLQVAFCLNHEEVFCIYVILLRETAFLFEMVYKE